MFDSICRKYSRQIKKYSRKIIYPIRLKTKYRVAIGEVLFSYLDYPLLYPERMFEIESYTNIWESREIVRILLGMGFNVDVINWDDSRFIPTKKYDVAFDICYNLSRWERYLDKKAIRLLHLTGSDPIFQNSAEIVRVQQFNGLHNSTCSPKRIIKNPDLSRLSIANATSCSLIGNDFTLRTYPDEFKNKITTVTVSGATLGSSRKSSDEFVPIEREFMWFSGSGAIHKGLDLLLGIFSRNSSLKLHIVGDVESETDFASVCKHELFELKNIEYHGYLPITSLKFQNILRKVFCFIMPSCSEGISTAVVNCLQIGLYPIISYQCGITLPPGNGIYIDSLTEDEIEKKILFAYRLSSNKLIEQIGNIQKNALIKYSRSQFQHEMRSYFESRLF